MIPAFERQGSGEYPVSGATRPVRPAVASPIRHSFDTLDLLRGVAAICVLAWHFVPIGGPSWWSAYLCVDLFFVLSGVVIAHAYEARLRTGWQFRRFLVTRIVRLWPLYLLGSAMGALSAALATVIAWRGDLHPWQFRDLAHEVVRASLLWPQMTPFTGPVFPLNRNAWSLLAEVVVNIGYGLVGFRLNNRAMAGVAIFGAVVTAWGARHFASWDAALNLGGLAIHLGVGFGRATTGFFAGVLLHRLWQADRLPRIAASPMLVVAVFVVLLFAIPGQGRFAPIMSWLAASLGMPAIVAVALQAEPSGMTRRLAKLGGRVSYPVYVLQDGFYLLAALLSARMIGSPFLDYAIAAVAVLCVASPAERRFDQPVRHWLAMRCGLRRSTPDSAPGL